MEGAGIQLAALVDSLIDLYLDVKVRSNEEVCMQL